MCKILLRTEEPPWVRAAATCIRPGKKYTFRRVDVVDWIITLIV
jgi:hypothetical protein